MNVGYNFLQLSLLFLLPGALIFALRRDLRPVIGVMALCSLPFAATERFFYPDYWQPRFLFDLIDVLGFGVEDLLFVVGLGAFTSTAYAAFTGARYRPLADGASDARSVARRAGALLGVTALLVAAVVAARVPMIYGAVAIMIGVGCFICWRRRQLLRPALLGGVLVMLVYGALCLLYGWLLPGVFRLTWHTERFLGVFVLGVPLEELLYGFAAGMVATVFYPFVAERRFVSRAELRR